MSCSSDDSNSNDNDDLNTEVQISISGDDIENATFIDLDFGLHQQCIIFELYSNTAFQNESLSVGYFLLQLEEITIPLNGTYSYDGPAINDTFQPINAQIEINSEMYEASYIVTEVTNRFYREQEFCGEFYGRVFNISFTLTLEHSNGTLAPITITGSTIDLPILDNCGC